MTNKKANNPKPKARPRIELTDYINNYLITLAAPRNISKTKVLSLLIDYTERHHQNTLTKYINDRHPADSKPKDKAQEAAP